MLLPCFLSLSDGWLPFHFGFREAQCSPRPDAIPVEFQRLRRGCTQSQHKCGQDREYVVVSWKGFEATPQTSQAPIRISKVLSSVLRFAELLSCFFPVPWPRFIEENSGERCLIRLHMEQACLTWKVDYHPHGKYTKPSSSPASNLGREEVVQASPTRQNFPSAGSLLILSR